MNTNRRAYYGYGPSMQKEIASINRNLGRAGFGLGILVMGGYFLYRKVDNLAKEVRKLKEEAGK